MKKPDEFLTVASHFFENLAKNPRIVGIVAGIFLVLIIAGAVLSSHQNTRSGEAKSALFVAEKTIEKELKAIASTKTADTAKATQADAAAAKDKAKDKEKEEMANLEATLYQKLDVDARFPESVSKLKEVSEKFAGTRSSYEAQLALGRLYADHGEQAKALPWLVRALGSAPSQQERVMAGLAVGHIQEDLGKYPEAIQDYEATAKIADGSFKGEALLSMARTFELMNDSTKARAVYDQIISTMAGTEYAKTAEQRKSQIE